MRSNSCLFEDIDILFIENVGNMVCPTDFRLGAEKRVVIVSSTEGDDVVNKHPMMFRDCDYRGNQQG